MWLWAVYIGRIIGMLSASTMERLKMVFICVFVHILFYRHSQWILTENTSICDFTISIQIWHETHDLLRCCPLKSNWTLSVPEVFQHCSEIIPGTLSEPADYGQYTKYQITFYLFCPFSIWLISSLCPSGNGRHCWLISSVSHFEFGTASKSKFSERIPAVNPFAMFCLFYPIGKWLEISPFSTFISSHFCARIQLEIAMEFIASDTSNWNACKWIAERRTDVFRKWDYLVFIRWFWGTGGWWSGTVSDGVHRDQEIQETEDGGFQVKYHTMDWMLWIGIDILFWWWIGSPYPIGQSLRIRWFVHWHFPLDSDWKFYIFSFSLNRKLSVFHSVFDWKCSP